MGTFGNRHKRYANELSFNNVRNPTSTFFDFPKCLQNSCKTLKTTLLRLWKHSNDDFNRKYSYYVVSLLCSFTSVPFIVKQVSTKRKYVARKKQASSSTFFALVLNINYDETCPKKRPHHSSIFSN